MHDDHELSDSTDGASNNPWADRVNEAYYDKMGDVFGRQTRDRINWICAQAKGKTVLDVGCSQGIAAILMAREGMKVVGLDIYRPAIDYALAERNKEIESVIARLDFRCSELAALEDEAFDTVVMGEVIEHQTNPTRFVEQGARLVAPGGRLVITVPFGLNPWPDHKATIFPRQVYSAVADGFRLTLLDVSNGYIRLVLDRREDTRIQDAESDALLEATEKGALESQSNYYEVNEKARALSKAAAELQARLEMQQRERDQQTAQKQELDKELALKAQLVGSLQQALADLKSAVGEQAQLVQGHADAREQRVGRIEELRQEVAVHKALSELTSRSLVQTEAARQSAVQRSEALAAELAQQKLECAGFATAGQQVPELEQATVLLQNQLHILKEENVAARQRIDSLSTQLLEKHQQVPELKQAALLLQNQLHTLKEENVAARQRIDSLSTQLLEQQNEGEELAVVRRRGQELEQIARQLQERLQSMESELAIAQHKRTGHYLHLEAERNRSRKLIPLLQELYRENQLYRQSIALEIGRAVLGLKSPMGMIRFPRAMARVWRTYRRRSGAEVAIEPLVLPRLEAVVLPSLKEGAGQAQVSGRLGVKDIAARRSMHELRTSGDEGRKQLSIVGWEQETRSSTVPVMSVLDEFSRSCFAPHASLIEPRPDNWEALLEACSPQLLLVESSWKGNYGTWQYRVANYANPPGRELTEMVEGFRARGIPTVFWNKEDPVHFNNFVEAASQFDIVLTTAAEAVPKYQEKTSVRAGVLQFAAEESLHNPIGSARRNGKVCFAGSFYANRFHERRDDQLMLLDAASEFDFDIFDRNHDPKATTKSDFAFPERFSRFVRGRMPYEAMGRAYREYRVFLNVNSVIDSPTMFSRRVFELLACGTPVVSTWSRGTEETFGDGLVWHVRNTEEAAEALQVLMTDDREWRRRSLAGIRAVLSRHTFRHRFRRILDIAGLSDETENSFERAVVVAEVSSQLEADAVAASFARQRMDADTSKQLLLVMRGGSQVSVREPDVEVLHDAGKSLADMLARVNPTAGSRLVARMSPLAAYGAHHLQDLLHAARYSKAAVIGRPADGNESSQYQYDIPLDPRTLLVNEALLRNTGIALDDVLTGRASGIVLRSVGKTYAADTANFLATDVAMNADRQARALSGIEL